MTIHEKLGKGLLMLPIDGLRRKSTIRPVGPDFGIPDVTPKIIRRKKDNIVYFLSIVRSNPEISN